MNRSIALLAVAGLLLAGLPALQAANPAAANPQAARKEAKQARQAAKAKKGDSERIPNKFKVDLDIVYKQVGDTKLDLILFRPLEKKFEKSPLVVYIHGGGWGGGDKYRVLKPQLLDVVYALNERGVTCASIEYRLMKAGSVTVMDCAADCKDAVRFLVKHADEYGIDPQRIGTFGSSAGGHLTLVTALGSDRDYPCDPALDGPPGKILCVAAYYPLVSILDPKMREGRTPERNENMDQAMLGGTLEEKHDLAVKLSPLDLVRADSPAILLAHGDADQALTYKNSTAMRDAAQAKGVSVECIISKGAGHSFSGKDIDPSIEEIDRRTIDFFMKYLGQP